MKNVKRPGNVYTALVTLPLIAINLVNPADASELSDQSDNTEFDLQSLQARGIDPKIADWFRQAPRFSPGESTVSLSLNGQARGKIKARFDAEGALCVDADFLKKAGLVTPSGFSAADGCADLKATWPQTELTLDPGEEKIMLVVPPEAVATSRDDLDNLNHGGSAGMLNYDAQYLDSSGSTSGVSFMQVGTEAGMNIGDWILRSRQTYSDFNDQRTLRHQGAYAQRTFTGLKKTLQAGQISLSNSMFGTGQVLGFQMVPESALQNGNTGAGLVEGIAGSQSVVEVRQSGALVYSTTVPAGPFRLQGFSLLNTRSDLDVTVTSSDGGKRRFTVPASAFLQGGPAVSPGLSFGVGKLEQQGNSEAPVLATLATGWALSPYTSLNAGILGSTLYRATAIGVDTQLFDATKLSLQSTAAEDTVHGNKGLLVSAVLNHNLTERVSVGVNASQRTQGYAELSDSLQDSSSDRSGQTREQVGANISWSQKSLGSLSLSWARSQTFKGDDHSYLRAGWSRQIGQTYVGASVEHDSGGSSGKSDNRMYLTLSIPFGSGKNISSYLNSSSKNTRGGLRYSDRTSQDRGWSLSSERDFRNQQASGTATVDQVTPYSQLSGSVTHNTDNNTNWSARASGGLVVHDKGVTLSPYRVRDTFGIAKVGNEAGVRLETASGPTWTDSRGYAVLPSVSTYRRSSVQVDTRSLGKNVDIDNAWQETAAARGSVSYVNFDVVRTRRVLAEVKDSKGQSLPHGASVFDAQGDFVTVVGDKGSVFIPDASSTQLDVQVSGETLCSFTLTLPEVADTGGLYETADAVCR